MFDFIKENPIICLVIFLLIVSPSFLFGAVQVIAVVVLILIVLGIVGLMTLRWRVSKFQREASERSRSQYGEANDPTTKIYSSQSNKKVADDVGDYVDFEEVKDK